MPLNVPTARRRIANALRRLANRIDQPTLTTGIRVATCRVIDAERRLAEARRQAQAAAGPRA